MRILVIPPNDLLRHPIPNRLYHILNRLSRNHEIYLLSYTGHPLSQPMPLRTLERTIEVSFKPIMTPKNIGLYYIVNILPIYHTIKKVMLDCNIDIVIHANILPSYITTLLTKRLKIGSIYEFLDYFPESASSYYKNTLLKKLVSSTTLAFIKSSLNKSDVVITPSFTHKHILEHSFKKNRVEVIPHGVDCSLFKPLNKHLIRQKLGIDEDLFLFLLYGSIDVWLDIETILEVIKKLQKVYKIGIITVGFSHGKYFYEFLLQKIREIGIKALFCPPQPYENMPFYINASDVVIAPYRQQIKNLGAPLKLFEVLSCGRPLVTTKIEEFHVWFKKGLFTYNNANELMVIMDRLLMEYETILEELNSYSTEIRKRFSWENVTLGYERIIESLCAKKTKDTT